MDVAQGRRDRLRAVVVRALLPALLLALAGAGHGGSAAAQRVPPKFFGMSWDREVADEPRSLQRREFRRMARSGVEALRTVFAWAVAEPVAGGGTSYARTDSLVADATRAGIELMPVVMYAPGWARSAPFTDAAPPRDPTEYAAYVGRLVDRYGPSGSFWAERPGLPRRPIRHWQIWNEPHLRWQWDLGSWDSSGWERGYLPLLREAHAAIKARDPGARVVLAGLTNFSWDEVARLYAIGAAAYFDVAALHTYVSSVGRVFRVARLFRREMRRNGDAGTPIYVTEVSWPAARGRARVPSYHRSIVTTDRGMASRLRRLFRRALRERGRYRLRRVYWYTWASAYTGDEAFQYAGLGVFRGGRWVGTPAWRSYRLAANG